MDTRQVRIPDHIVLDDQILVDKVGAVNIVSMNTPDFSRGNKNHVWFLFCIKPLHGHRIK